jgi:hypothetical protein
MKITKIIGINTMVRSTNEAGEVQCPGRVVALFEADYFVKKMCRPGMDPNEVWSIKFPEWKTKPVVLVSFVEPYRTTTFEEWMTQGVEKGYSLRNWSEVEWREDYEENCPVMSEMCFPADDLEIIDE